MSAERSYRGPSFRPRLMLAHSIRSTNKGAQGSSTTSSYLEDGHHQSSLAFSASLAFLAFRTGQFATTCPFSWQ